MIELPLGAAFETLIDWLKANFEPAFDAISAGLRGAVETFEQGLLFVPWPALTLVLALLAWRLSGRGAGAFTLAGMLAIEGMGLWHATMETLALVLASALVALSAGVPLGIWCSRRDVLAGAVRPVLDLMQTMPAFVYLIPAVLFFRLGKVPGAVATVIFAMPPAVRLTNLGIRQVPADVVDAARAFGATPRQLLAKVLLPIALPTILAGVNQTIMLALSMVVISAMIGAGGLGQEVLKGITQLQIGPGFESGIAVVILAIVLDRMTQGLAELRSTSSKGERR